jgi:hypothetical protein
MAGPGSWIPRQADLLSAGRSPASPRSISEQAPTSEHAPYARDMPAFPLCAKLTKTESRGKVSPAAAGPATVEIERFDPVFGWQFYRQVSAFVSEGAASLPFVPPAVGQWRAKATYGGSRVWSPSAVGFSYLLVSREPGLRYVGRARVTLNDRRARAW